ncbi:hypothetical protein BKA70DRAFT_1424639 [Coprinopsis sp. MPI-PUGE-AT-0042]|nr:hypothetical protein BKA70DRAFT_1424639 [Coprinopsis sp. MPI-PUGE-AT-0042]
MEDNYSMYREEEVKKEETLGLRGRDGGSSTQEGRGYRCRDRPLRHHGKGTLWSTRRALQVRWHNMWRKEQAPGNLKDRISGYHQFVDETIRNNCISCYQLKCQPIELSFTMLNEARNPFRSPSTTIESAVHLLDGFNSEAVSFADNEKLVLALGGKMARALRASDTSNIYDPDTILSIAVKACVTYWAGWFITSRHPFEWGKKHAADSRRSTTKALLNSAYDANPAYLGEYIYGLLVVVATSPPKVKPSLISWLAIPVDPLLFDDDVTDSDLAP